VARQLGYTAVVAVIIPLIVMLTVALTRPGVLPRDGEPSSPAALIDLDCFQSKGPCHLGPWQSDWQPRWSLASCGAACRDEAQAS
jgi:hypothetical protein